MSKKTTLLGCLAIVVSMPVSWHIGWIVWDIFELSHYLKLSIYQNLLYAIVFVYLTSAMLVWAWKTGRAGTPTQSLTIEKANVPVEKITVPVTNKSPATPTNPDFKKLEGQISEILEKQTDTHAIMKFLKTQQEKAVKPEKIVASLPQDVTDELARMQKEKEAKKKNEKPDKGA